MRRFNRVRFPDFDRLFPDYVALLGDNDRDGKRAGSDKEGNAKTHNCTRRYQTDSTEQPAKLYRAVSVRELAITWV